MAIKHVGELVLAWCRGHEIVCNACKCKNVRSKLHLESIINPLGVRVLLLSHDETMAPLAYKYPEDYEHSTGKWMPNGLPYENETTFLNSITILRGEE